MRDLLGDFAVYDQRRHDGTLRYCMIRQGKNTDQTMVVLSISRQGNHTDTIREILLSDETLQSRVTTMMLIEHDGLGGVIADAESVWHTLWGEGTIQEALSIDGQVFDFALSPQSFFQTNTRGAELLYSTVANILQESQATTLFDLYCGTGTIGLIIGSLVPSISQVVGIDIVPEAIDDARANAKRLEVDFQTEYHAGRVEDIFPTLTVGEQSTIIVDPPRAGLHQ